MVCLDEPFFFFSVPRPLALELDLALAFGILEDLVTLVNDLDFGEGLVGFCVALNLALGRGAII